MPSIKAKEPLFLPDPDDIGGPIQIGIGLFNQKTTSVLMWALVFDDRSDYLNTEVTKLNVVGLVKKPSPTPGCPNDFTWDLREEWNANELEDPLAIIHVGEIKSTCDSLRSFLLRLDAGRNAIKGPKELENPGGITVWGSAAWVIRALAHLNAKFEKKKKEEEKKSGDRKPMEKAEAKFLACTPKAIHPNVYNNLDKLREEKRRLKPRQPVVNYTLKTLYELGTMNR